MKLYPKILTKLSVLVIVILFISCTQTEKSPERKGDIKIGAIFDLTGTLAYMGKWSQNGASLAIDNINNHGGINGRKVSLLIEDGGSDVNKNVSAFRKLIDSDKVALVIGFNSSSAVMAAAPIANTTKTVLLTSGTGSPNITDAGDYIFRNRLSGKLEVDAIANFIALKRNIKEIGVLYINNEYGKGYASIFQSAFEAHGGKILLEEGFEQNQTNFKSMVRKLKDNNIQAIYLIAYAKEGGILLKQSYEQNFMPQWFSANPIEAPEFLEIAGKSAEGIIYSIAKYDPNDVLSKQFNAEYKEKYGMDSEIFAANTYDAVNIGVLAIANTDGSGEQIKTYLYDSIKDYPGVAGLTTFDHNGDVTKPAIIKILKNGQFTLLE